MTEESGFNWIKDIPQWGSFVGMFLVSFLAMYLNRMKSWFCRPKIRAEIKGSNTYCEISDEAVGAGCNSESRDKVKTYNWCLRVRNVGRQAAINCKVQCTKIYCEHDTGGRFTLKTEFIAKPLFWLSGERKEDVVPGQDSWCRVITLSPVEIQRRYRDGHEELGESSRKGTLHLFLGVESGRPGRYVSLSSKNRNTFLIPLTISYDNARVAEEVWLYVHWTEGEEKPNQENFMIEVYDGKKARGLIREAV